MRRDVVISHGGCGTTVAALFHGRPAVVVPLFADQPYNAQRLTERGLGVAVSGADLASQLPAALQNVLTGSGFALRTAEVAAAMAHTPTADEALSQLLSSSAVAG